MTVRYESNVFQGTTVELGNAAWLRNSFEQCRLIVSALPADWVDNDLAGCRFEFPSGDLTPVRFAEWAATKDPRFAAALREWIARNSSAGKSLHSHVPFPECKA